MLGDEDSQSDSGDSNWAPDDEPTVSPVGHDYFLRSAGRKRVRFDASVEVIPTLSGNDGNPANKKSKVSADTSRTGLGL